MPPVDPLADLRAEIVAQEATLTQEEEQTQADEAAAVAAREAEEVEGAEEGEGGVAQAEKPAKKAEVEEPEERTIPAARFNQVAAENRKLKTQFDALQKQLDDLKNPKKPGEEKVLTPEQQRDQIRAQERANARLEIQVENFLDAGYGKYTQKEFDAACSRIGDLIEGPNDLVAVAIEATGTPKAAADALFLLGQNDVPEIEAFLGLSKIKQAAQLARLANTRPSRAKQEEEPAPGKTRRAKVEDPDDPPAPLRPLKGSSRIPEGLTDDVPDDVFFDRFEKTIMNKGRSVN